MKLSFFIALLIVLIVICAVIGPIGLDNDTRSQVQQTKTYPSEIHSIKAYNEHYVSGGDNSVLLTKSIAYFKYVATTFMTDDLYNSYYPSVPSLCTGPNQSACPILQIFKFLPTFLDASCSLLTPPTPNCNQFFIDNITTLDNTAYDSPMVCSNVASSVSMPKSNSMVRIMSNNYSFMKRCIQLNIISATLIGTGNTYVVNCIGNIDLLVLLRPCFISFASLGLFSISLFSTTTSTTAGQPNSLLNYSNKSETNSSQFTLYLSWIGLTDVHDVQVYPEVNGVATPLNAIANKSIQLFPTIYFMNYESPADYFSSTSLVTFNTMSLCFNKATLTSSDWNLPKQLVFTPQSGTASNACNNMTMHWSTTGPDVFYITMATSVSGGDLAHKYSVHSDFSSLVHNSTAGSVYHVFVTYTLDLLIIVGMYKDLSMSNGKSSFNIVQYKVRDNNQPVYLSYMSSDTTSLSNKDIISNSTVVPLSSIPNFANMAKQLGYSFTKR